jgi:diadenosine tetraphosphatase ApaH/serine/threonine PP2A family protein phosphatase
MRIALLSDLHANRRALDACLADAATQRVDRHAVLGDLVGYGAEPEAVVDRVQGLAEAGAWVLRGNHDTIAAGGPGTLPPGPVTGETESAGWTAERLGPQRRAWLAELPLQARVGTALLVHASADRASSWPYVDDERMAERCMDAALADDPAVRHVMCGHVHVQRLFYRGSGRTWMRFEPTPGVAVPVPAHRHWVATLGSVGQPRDRRTEAAYAVLDLAAGRLAFRRVPYDHLGAAQAIRDAGLPEWQAQRLLEGR